MSRHGGMNNCSRNSSIVLDFATDVAYVWTGQPAMGRETGITGNVPTLAGSVAAA